MNNIHPTSVIDDCVEMGDHNYIGPFCELTGGLTIGDHNWVESHCSVGTRPEHQDFWHSDGKTQIGNNNMFREHMTIHSGTDGLKIFGNNCI